MQRPALLFGLLTAGVAGAGTSPTEMKRVAGKVTLVASICRGGAAITRDDMARLPPAQPIGGKEILIVAGGQIRATRPVARFITRSDGTFVTHLPPGKWCFFDAARRPSTPRDRAVEPEVHPKATPVTRSGTDPGCLEAEKQRCDLVLAVKADVNRAAITFTERCPQVWNQPCYRGPAPP